VNEEEGEMFPKAKRAKVDTEALGATMLKRKMALMEKMGLNDDEDAGDDAKRKSTGTARR
jgi:ribosome assembly protein YihI (activator of Der GTPase)